jgi:hypothetical protein
MSNDGIIRSPTTDPKPVIQVQPIRLNPALESPQAAINTVNAESDKANMLNNMHGGWVPKSKVKTKKIKDVKGGARSRRRRAYSRRRRLTASDARVSRRLRMRMLQRRIKKRKSRRRGSLRGGQATVPQHGTSCTNPNDTNCAGNISKGMLDLSAQAAANSQGDSIKPVSS